jgi:hypothetical protein
MLKVNKGKCILAYNPCVSFYDAWAISYGDECLSCMEKFFKSEDNSFEYYWNKIMSDINYGQLKSAHFILCLLIEQKRNNKA